MVPAPAQQRRRLLLTTARVALVAGVVAVSVLSLIPGEELPEVDISDKVQHGAAYLALAAVGIFAFPRQPLRWRIGLGLLVLGLVLELLQRVVPGRYFDVWDMVANAVGVLLGYVVVSFALKRIEARDRAAAAV